MNFNFPQSILNFKLNYSNNIINELKLKNLTFNDVINATNFTNEINNVKDYLSSYGTLFDGTNFYYDKDILSQHSDIQILQIIMCEFLNFFGLYHTSNRKINDRNKEIIRSHNLFFLSCMGLTKFVSAGQSIRSKLIPYYIKKHGELDVIVFHPNEKSLNYLFNLMINGHESVLKFLPGYRLDNEKYIYIDVFSAYLDGASGSRNNGIYCRLKSRYEEKTCQWAHAHRIYVYDKMRNKLAKKSSEEYTDFTDSIKIMKELSL